MYLLSYRDNGLWRAGVSDGARLVDLASLGDPQGDRPPTVRALLEAGPKAVAAALARAASVLGAGDAAAFALNAIEVGPPVPDPDKIICLGLNYRDHAAETGLQVPPVPTLFPKYRNSLIGPRGAIRMPRQSREIDYEAELAVVIGRRCKDVAEADALGCVAGYAAFNDVSARDLQFQTGQWMAGKALDTFAPMGPGLVPASQIPDPQALQLVTRVNGRVLQSGNTGDMIFPVAQTIAFLSSLMTLEPGDIIATGTPAGVGFKRQPPVYLAPGDIVEIEIERIGLIRNAVVGPDDPAGA